MAMEVVASGSGERMVSADLGVGVGGSSGEQSGQIFPKLSKGQLQYAQVASCSTVWMSCILPSPLPPFLAASLA